MLKITNRSDNKVVVVGVAGDRVCKDDRIWSQSVGPNRVIGAFTGYLDHIVIGDDCWIEMDHA